MKRVASIQDISCLGRCSLTVALPVISAMEVECAILPTAVLSAHTMFPDILCRDLTADILPIARYWQSQQVQLDAVYTGYLASPRQAEDVCRVLEVLAGPDIVSRGFVYVREAEDLMNEANGVVRRTLENCTHDGVREWGNIKQMIRDDLSRFLFNKTKRSPMILPIIEEV